MRADVRERIELINRGEVTKQYKNTELAMIPATWELVNLNDICCKITDGTHKTPTYLEDGIKFISAKNINNGLIDWSNVRYISIEEHTELIKRCNPEDNDILLSKSGTLGNLALIHKEFEFSLFESLALIKYDRSKINGNFLYQFLRSPLMEKTFGLSTKGLSVKHLHLEDIKKFKIILPSKFEQEKISQILSTWDKAIVLKENLIEEKIQQKKGLMHTLMSGKKRVLGFNEKWKDCTLGDVLFFIKKQPINNPQDYFLLTVKLHNKGIEATNKKPNVTQKGRSYYLREPNELLIGRQNFHNGGVGIVPSHMVGYIASNAISSLGVKDGILKFYYYYISNIDFYKKVEDLIGGTGQKEISESMFKKLKIKIPTLEQELAKIVEIIDNCEIEILLLEKELQLIKQQKQGLMQLLLTGKIRVIGGN